METSQLRPDDENAIMNALGPEVPVILREALDSGFDAYQRSRDRDPVGHADYRPTTQANMLVDRIYPYLQDLTLAVDGEGERLETRDTSNGRATELYVGPALYLKFKRVKDRTRRVRPDEDLAIEGMGEIEVIDFGMPRSVRTKRVLQQLYPYQPLLPGVPPLARTDDSANRLCLVSAFDLDLAQETILRPRIGVCDAKRWLWSRALPVLEPEAIAAISPALEEKVRELRQNRSA